MKTFLLAALSALSLVGTASASAGFCNFTGSLTNTGDSITYDNRTSACTSFVYAMVAHSSDTISIAFQGAPDLFGTPGTFATLPADSGQTTWPDLRASRMLCPTCTRYNPVTLPGHTPYNVYLSGVTSQWIRVTVLVRRNQTGSSNPPVQIAALGDKSGFVTSLVYDGVGNWLAAPLLYGDDTDSYCTFTGTMSNSDDSTIFDNRSKACIGFTYEFTSSAPVTVVMERAYDNNGAPGTWYPMTPQTGAGNLFVCWNPITASSYTCHLGQNNVSHSGGLPDPSLAWVRIRLVSGSTPMTFHAIGGNSITNNMALSLAWNGGDWIEPGL